MPSAIQRTPNGQSALSIVHKRLHLIGSTTLDERGFKAVVFSRGLIDMDEFGGGGIETSICPNCGHMPGAWLPGLPCPECGELLL